MAIPNPARFEAFKPIPKFYTDAARPPAIEWNCVYDAEQSPSIQAASDLYNATKSLQVNEFGKAGPAICMGYVAKDDAALWICQDADAGGPDMTKQDGKMENNPEFNNGHGFTDGSMKRRKRKKKRRVSPEGTAAAKRSSSSSLSTISDDGGLRKRMPVEVDFGAPPAPTQPIGPAGGNTYGVRNYDVLMALQKIYDACRKPGANGDPDPQFLGGSYPLSNKTWILVDKKP
ncbi:MAG: hypothetical protein M1831_002932 [Alyxoria varia]|nr:MAG: hypothetical protein M1831_002932 [Alyxoria varia]